MLTLAPTAAHAQCGSIVAVQTDPDKTACGDWVAVHPTGTAATTGGQGTAPGIAVSGTGSASNTAGDDSCAAGGGAVTGPGPAATTPGTDSCGRFGSPDTRPSGVSCVAVSGTGPASNRSAGSCGDSAAARRPAVGCVAFSGT